ncbi:MAG: TetR/AcrR family transcriptional regulator [Bryobacteraceae bacterium]
MGVAERKARHRSELRQEILEAARDLFVTEGVRNVSMRRIAEKIEYSPTTIYLHFKDKEDLLFQICEDTFRQLSEQFEELEQSKSQCPPEQPYDPVDCLRRGLEIYLNFGIQHPNHYKVAFMTEPDPSCEDSSKYHDPNSMGMRAYGYLRHSVEQCVIQGRFPNLDVSLASEALWAAVHGVTSLLVLYPNFPWSNREKVGAEVIDRMIAGFEK